MNEMKPVQPQIQIPYAPQTPHAPHARPHGPLIPYEPQIQTGALIPQIPHRKD